MSTGPIVDLHTHWFPPEAAALMLGRGEAPRFAQEGSGVVAVSRSAPPFPLGAHFFDLDMRIEHLKATGVIHQLMSWPTTLGVEPELPVEEAKALWRAYNDGVSALVRRRPDLFSALAAVSTVDVAWSVRELQRAHEELGLVGVVLPVNALASRRSAEALRPLFAAAQAHRSHVYLHTGYGGGGLPGQPAKLVHGDSAPIRDAIETMLHYAEAAVTLAFTDFLDDFPDVTVQIAMLGGSGLTALMIEQALQSPARYGGVDPRPRLRRIWLDTGAAGHGPAAIGAAAAALGADRIVFGSDYAPAPDIRRVVDDVLAAPLDADQRRRIFFANGAGLLQRMGVSLKLEPA